MDTTAMASPFLERVRRDVPYVFEPGYQMDEASGLMRRERFIHVLQYGHSLLSAAVHNENISTADLIGIEDAESMETEQGLSRHRYGSLAMKDKVFVGNLMRFAEMIAVRTVIHLTVDDCKVFEQHPALQEAARRLGFAKCLFPMSSFGCRTQSLTTLWGTDKFIIKGVKHVAGRLMSMLLDCNLCMCPCYEGVRFSCLLMRQLVSGSLLCATGDRVGCHRLCRTSAITRARTPTVPLSCNLQLSMAWLVGLWFGDSGMRLGGGATPTEC
ncbi:unnamed protein product [Symbiodinium sp. CCMP2592]|nr:unnamed protein product [Symbiodinium sp. CCMP2592]CAE7593427.1 unnamed protein product [Symbiodinium sp. CCMP2592]